ncbi:MAG: 16S rRNA (adenine(1518)-N(6)/adenine(1519)-N(6))-dimethyltransferase RsmA [Bacteroidales bacterium]|jgi:16S rRNA (adenine1518-N6/adenine1519-N6)-dimethyltransferase|nr:16S rRNA (adenine(1518)-N(6)/adenine(1519)-N(6))-dimethyltransferase RsmA [Bacteroidales bacterium]
MNEVRAKKHLGQHFLTDKNIARKISLSLGKKDCSNVLEIGPGMGILTSFLIDRRFKNFKAVEIDHEAAAYLERKFKDLDLIEGDFLDMDLDSYFKGDLAIIGNFPYNISSQIFFRVLKYRDKICELTGMLQKEVADRIVSGPGTKVYGILSVLLQAYYDVEYLFTVPPGVFMPPPKVKSAVISLARREGETVKFDEDLFFRVVKVTFNQRRKTIKNSLKSLVDASGIDNELLRERPEQLGVNDFIELSELVKALLNKNTKSHVKDN